MELISKIFLLHGVDIDRFSLKKVDKKKAELIRKKYRIPKEANVIFTLGRVTYYKGIDTLIDIVRIVRERYPNTYLIIGGPLWDKKYVDSLKSKSNNHIIFAGLIDEKELAEFYYLCDIYTTCSRWEGQLNSEAMAMERPYSGFEVTTLFHCTEI